MPIKLMKIQKDKETETEKSQMSCPKSHTTNWQSHKNKKVNCKTYLNHYMHLQNTFTEYTVYKHVNSLDYTFILYRFIPLSAIKTSVLIGYTLNYKR